MSNDAYVPEVGPWAEEKLKCLNDYLSAYTTILRKQRFKGYVYIDAFAGAGIAKIRKKETPQVEDNFFLGLLEAEQDAGQERYILGSPRIALELQHPFTNYVFVELSEKRRKELEKLAKQHAGKDVRIYDRNCNDYLLELLNKDVKWEQWRGVVFLDPFGAHVPWETVNALARTKSFEVFINFPWMAITRLANNDANIPEGHRAILDRYFGSDKWFEVMYKKEQTLFGDQHNKADDAAHALVNWYRKRLQTAFGHASSARLIRNTRGSPLYYLIWAGPNKTGLKIANHILSQGEAI